MRLFFVGALRLSEVHEWKSYLKKKTWLPMATLTNKRHVGLHDLHVIDSFLIIIRLR